MALEKFQRPRTVTALRSFLGLTNYYSSYVPGYAKVVACLQDKLKLTRKDGKKGSKLPITWDPEDQEAFDEVKKLLLGKLSLFHVNPDKPFVLRTDACGYAVGAVLEQMPDSDELPTAADCIAGRTIPVAFMSRKLTEGQRRWVPREQETYAILLALSKWETWIGLQPVLVLTDHKAIESWAKEVLDTPSGPVGRRARWHEIFSRYDLTIDYCPGKDNIVADVLSRWAYPASQALRDVSKHGSAKDEDDMHELIRIEREEERDCLQVSRTCKANPSTSNVIYLKDPPLLSCSWLHGQGPRPVPFKGMYQATHQYFAEGTAVCAKTVARPVNTSPDTFTFKRPKPPARQPNPEVPRPTPPSGPVAPSGNQPTFRFKTPPPGARRLSEQPSPATNMPQESPSTEQETGSMRQQPSAPSPVLYPESEEYEVGGGLEIPEQEAQGAQEGEPPPEPLEPEEEEGRRWFQDEDEEEEIEETTGFHQPLIPLTDHEVLANQLHYMDWSHEYSKCPTFSKKWELLHQRDIEWPSDWKIMPPYLVWAEKICIPMSAQRGWIREYHDLCGHVGFKRLWKQLDAKYDFADPSDAKKFAKLVMGQCETCQACRATTRSQLGLEPTLVPETVMTHVCMDIFKLPTVTVNEEIFDSLALCVDRLSGWIVAIPGRNEGMTAEWVAKRMYEQSWRLFGIPSVITSDQGAQFVGVWWKTLCAKMGVRIAYSHAYHPQANGRAEVAGQTLISKLRLFNQDTGENWLDLLPRALDVIHDSPGESGFSPYQLMFGRDRPMQGLPYTLPRESRDARFFCRDLARMREIAAAVLNRKHFTHVRTSNEPERIFNPGDLVWYHRPPRTGDKLDSRWLGPAKTLLRKSLRGYVIQLKEGKELDAPLVFLKKYVVDQYSGIKAKLFFHTRTPISAPLREDEHIVEKILRHQTMPNGELRFLTKWVGSVDTTWEPVTQFVPVFNTELVDYCKRKGLCVDLSQHLHTVQETQAEVPE